MRSVPSYMAERLQRNIQTRANDSDVHARILVTRPSTALVDDRFLERQTILEANITDVSIAVCHPRARRGNTEIFVAYISKGVAKVVSAKHKLSIDQHVWTDSGFSENATAVSIAFDGTMLKTYGSEVEFVSETKPWVFWIDNGALYAKRLDSKEPSTVLAESNCTDVSAIRATWSSAQSDNFGLVVFFILDGVIHYRQLIDGEWYDAEVVNFGPSNAVWSEIAAFRTWDYRIGLQCKSSTDDIYEMFTQFMGVAKHNTEHVTINSVDVASKFAGIKYRDRKSGDEHVKLSAKVKSALLYGQSSKPVQVHNIDDGTGNYGKIVQVTMDYPVSNVSSNYSNFVLVDDNNTTYVCTEASVDESGLVMQLSFMDFNMAEGRGMTLVYNQGSIQSPAATLDAFLVGFAPVALVAPNIPVPEPVKAWTMNSEGTEIALEFSEAITGRIDGNTDKFVIENKEYEMVPDGKLISCTKPVVDIDMYCAAEETIALSSGASAGLYSNGNILTLEAK